MNALVSWVTEAAAAAAAASFAAMWSLGDITPGSLTGSGVKRHRITTSSNQQCHGTLCVSMATRRRPSKGGEQARDDAGLPQDRLQAWYRKLLVAEAEYDKETFEELYDVIYWFRQGLSFILGLVWGLIPVTGLPGIASFLFLSVGLPFLYYTKYLKVDEDSYGRLTLVQEGLQSAAGVFLTTWIITYTYAHGNKVAT